MADFASGRHARGVCDVCGQTFKLKQLKAVVERGRVTGVKACPDCWDEDHPQNYVGRYVFTDPQALRDPRPDPYNPEVD